MLETAVQAAIIGFVVFFLVIAATKFWPRLEFTSITPAIAVFIALIAVCVSTLTR